MQPRRPSSFVCPSRVSVQEGAKEGERHMVSSAPRLEGCDPKVPSRQSQLGRRATPIVRRKSGAP
eukprot:12628708-Alexandrium_andersonii.AAC.1